MQSAVPHHFTVQNNQQEEWLRFSNLIAHTGPGGRTKAQLYNEAKSKGIKGRSKMNKAQLQRAVDRD